MGEVEMAPAAARASLHRLHDGSMSADPPLETGIRPVTRIEVQHHESGDDAGDDGEIGVRPTSEPVRGELAFISFPQPLNSNSPRTGCLSCGRGRSARMDRRPIPALEGSVWRGCA